MDVTFTNVLEGARQYFQGLPAGSGSTASPAYPEGHHRIENEQNSIDRPPSASYWPQAQDPQRTPSREHTPVQQQRPSSHNSDSSRPPSHSQYLPNIPIESSRVAHYQSSYQEPTVSQTQFQFSRPHSREAPSNNAHTQYPQHIATSAAYHQPRIQTSHSQESQLVHHPQSSQPYQNYHQSRYYPVHSQPITTTSTVSYPAASNQTYQSSQQQNAYYKHIYTSQPQVSSPNIQYTSSGTSLQRYPDIRQQPTSVQNPVVQNESFKTTHNLPPIAALSAVNYHSRNNREPIRPNTSRPRTSSITVPSSVQHQTPISSGSTIPNSSAMPYSSMGYSDYHRNVSHHNTQPNQTASNSNQYQYSTSTTQAYSNVIMTTAATTNTFAAPHQSSGQYFQSSKLQQPHQRTQPSANTLPNNQPTMPQPIQHFNGRLAPVLKQKRESPLDLSVKTVRTSADSTLDDVDHDARMKYHHPNRTSFLPSHNYPVHDVQRTFNQRTQVQQSVSAPKVEFRPNFDIRSYVPEQPRLPAPDKTHNTNRGSYPPNQQPNTSNRYPIVPIPTAHLNTYVQQKKPEGIPRIDFPSPSYGLKSSSSYNHSTHDLNKKRPSEPAPPTVPKKIPRNDDIAWRQSIDLQIDQKLSNYKQEQQQKYNNIPSKPVIMNGSRPQMNLEKKKDAMPVRQASAYHQNVPQQPFANYQSQSNHNQTYVPSPATHQYPGYSSNYVNQQQAATYPYGLPRTNSTPSVYTGKNNMGGGADKRVISLLRNSLEVKGQKRLEQSKINEGVQQGTHARSDVQHPSTDVTAPMQPKPGLISRNNVSPFTPTSFPETNNSMPTYKFHMPKAVDSVNYDSDNRNNVDIKPNDDIQTILSTNSTNSEYDGLAALVAARIRTKGELKQGGPTPDNNLNLKSQPSYIELKSPVKQEFSQSSSFSSSSTSVSSVSPPKVVKERASLIPPRRRLFSRNEEDQGNNNVPLRDKSGLRSSSETSIYDFPDSDSDNEAGRQSLHAMRRDRKASIKHTNVVDIKGESPKPPSPSEDIFAQLCDNFVEQLKSGTCKKKGRRKKNEIDTVEKVEIVDEIITKCEPIDIPEQNSVSKEVLQTEKILQIDQIKTEPLIRKPDELVIKIESMDSPAKEKSDNLTNSKLSLFSDRDKDFEKTSANVEQTNETEDISNTNQNVITNETSKLEVPIVARPPKKPSFGDGSDFCPGWEESVYKYKKSLRMPPTLIRVTRPPKFHRLSTSLPDLDPCPNSPTLSVTTEGSDTNRKITKIKSEPLDSDADSNCSFNLFSKQSNYDSEGGSSIKSLPNTAKEGNSILDRLLEKCGNKKRKKYKKKDDTNPKIIPKSENPIELLPTPGLDALNKVTEKSEESPIIKTESPILGFRKKTMDVYKEEFIKKSTSLNVNKFATVVLNTRTRKETRVHKHRATIKEVFGDDRPASAPPVTCVNEVRIKQEVVEEKDKVDDKEDDSSFEQQIDQTFQSDFLGTKLMLKNKLLSKGKKPSNNLPNLIGDFKIKAEVEEELEVDIMKDILIKRDPDDKSETPSIDDDGSISGKKKSKLRNMRRKFSSGFDYIRKKKKVKKEIAEAENVTAKVKRRGAPSKANPESVQDIQKEIKTWVLNKGIGETHLHRAARLGYTDITAFCLEKMDCPPSPKDNAGYTPLHEACSRGHLDIAKLLLLYGANVSESAQGGIRPLHEAVENGFVEIVRLLLSYGADPSLATYSGLTPLALAKDETTMQILKDHLDDVNGVPGPPWSFSGFYSEEDLQENGYNVIDEPPEGDPESEDEDIEFEVSEVLLPNLYTLRGESSGDRWVLLQDLSSILKIKSRDALLRQICPASSSSCLANYKSVLRELKMTDFLEQAHCCQFLNTGEKINTRASKIALIKYTDKVKELLNIETVVVTTS